MDLRLPVGWAKHGAFADGESDLQGGKTGRYAKKDLPEGRSEDSGFCYAALFAFAVGFGSDLAAFLAFCFAANSCFILMATASVSTP